MNEWKNEEVKSIRAKHCSYSDVHKKTIHLSNKIKSIINKLCEEVKIEWQMFLIGSIDEKSVNVVDYYIPSQVVTGASVKNNESVTKEFIEEKGIVASIHSHGSLDVFFSSTDEETNYSDIQFHIVVNNKDEYKAIMQVELPCGMVTCKDVDVVYGERFEGEIEGINKIERYTHTVNAYQNYRKPMDAYIDNDKQMVFPADDYTEYVHGSDNRKERIYGFHNEEELDEYRNFYNQ